jgi:CBS domain-containing protein
MCMCDCASVGFLTKVVCVSESLSALEALRLMYERKLTGVGVVDADGCLVANFSVSDLRVCATLLCVCVCVCVCMCVWVGVWVRASVCVHHDRVGSSDRLRLCAAHTCHGRVW